MAFLPVTRKQMEERGWDQCDFVYVCGDAYVDHSSFGMAIITRLLEANGYKVGIIAQPDWHDPASIDVFGEPRLAFLVSAGNMDSMVCHYTVAKKHRNRDFYSPGGQMGLRPDHASVVYGNLIRRTHKDTPVIMGGVEASLRRLAHYDYWSDKLKRSVLLDGGADMISYGMGEKSIVAIADALNAGIPISQITWIEGTAFRSHNLEGVMDGYVSLPSFESMRVDKLKYAESFRLQYRNLDPFSGKCLVEPYEQDNLYIVQNPPSTPLSTPEFDAVYRLPYERTYHPMYEAAGGIPAISEVKFSLTSNRGVLASARSVPWRSIRVALFKAVARRAWLRKRRPSHKTPISRGISTMWVVQRQTSVSRLVPNSSIKVHAAENAVWHRSPAGACRWTIAIT